MVKRKIMINKKSDEMRAICGICSAGCGVIVTYDNDGKIASVRADEHSELGIICNLENTHLR